MRRISIYVVYSLTVIALVVSFDLYFQRKWNLDFYRKDFFAKADRLNGETYVARLIDRAKEQLEERSDERSGDLSQYLENRRQMGRIDFWIVLQNGVPLASAPQELAVTQNFLQNLNLQASPSEVIKDANRQIYYAVDRLKNDRLLVVGLAYSEKEFLRVEQKAEAGYIWRYLLGVLSIAIGTFIFFIGDILRSVRELRAKRGSVGAHSTHPFSKEADVLSRGLNAFATQAHELRAEKQRLSFQMQPSLRNEMSSGLTAPYEFQCALVRTDINGFTNIYNNFPVEEFSATINDFFTDVTHIVNRYGGFVHEFVGDEVIYYFKETAGENAAASALAAIRDVGQAATRYHQMTARDRGYSFTVKSTLAEGKLRFAKLVDGFGLAGPPFVESVRVLSTIGEKDGNAVVCDERHIEKSAGVATFAPYATVHLKGYGEPKSLYRLLDYRSIESVCEWGVGQKIDISYHRSDRDISFILHWLAGGWSTGPAFEVLEAIQRLQVIRISRFSLSFAKTLADLLSSLLHKDCLDVNGYRILASAISLVENLVAPAEISPEIDAALELALNSIDRRVVANAIEALSSRQSKISPNLDFAEHIDNRIAANILKFSGTRELTPHLVKKLRKMLVAKSPARVASGIWALGEIAQYHRTRDPVYYKTQIEFLLLIEQLPVYAKSSNERIRNQAVLAARKSNDQQLIDRVEIETATRSERRAN